jgi:hypothetical protein
MFNHHWEFIVDIDSNMTKQLLFNEHFLTTKTTEQNLQGGWKAKMVLMKPVLTNAALQHLALFR